MDKKRILQVLGPGVAAAAVVLLVGLLITASDWAEPGQGKAGKNTPLPPVAAGKGAAVAQDQANDSGMSDSLPPTETPEWKDAGGGMKLWDVVAGTGDIECPAGAKVVMHYTGWNLNGSVFDSSRTRGEPLNMGLGGLIKGWQLGVPGMKPGGIRRLYIPGDLAYGSRGSPPKIGPNATLVFEVKLLSFGP